MLRTDHFLRFEVVTSVAEIPRGVAVDPYAALVAHGLNP